jgi:hypothetical protein
MFSYWSRRTSAGSLPRQRHCRAQRPPIPFQKNLRKFIAVVCLYTHKGAAQQRLNIHKNIKGAFRFPDKLTPSIFEIRAKKYLRRSSKKHPSYLSQTAAMVIAAKAASWDMEMDFQLNDSSNST